MLSSLPIKCPGYLLAKAEKLPSVRAAVVNPTSKTSLQSARLATEVGLISPVLVGDTAIIKALAEQIGWDIYGIRLVPSEGEMAAAELAVALARGKEVATLIQGDIQAVDLLRVVVDEQQGLLKGKHLSHVFHMTVPTSSKVLCITDAVINVLPSVDERLEIARNAVGLMHALGNIEPRVAVLSASEEAATSMPSSVDATFISEASARGAVKGARVFGPLTFDSAVSAEVARIKSIANPVAGNADIVLVPNVETGSALCQQMVYFMSAAAAGIVLGASVPIVLNASADEAATRLAAAALASIYAAST
ncbi:MAG: bifunctional enoyl-CoA hydratase/phosphate acetyltransferase [Gammaproteobacteria bacterium]|nr:bifunctional enoyl-CoA hydratase/phosphate acetyltransferase [Gammaproteobacteria bacterium]